MQVSKCIFCVHICSSTHSQKWFPFWMLFSCWTTKNSHSYTFNSFFRSLSFIVASLWCLMMSLNGLWFYDLLKVFPFPFNFSFLLARSWNSFTTFFRSLISSFIFILCICYFILAPFKHRICRWAVYTTWGYRNIRWSLKHTHKTPLSWSMSNFLLFL